MAGNNNSLYYSEGTGPGNWQVMSIDVCMHVVIPRKYLSNHSLFPLSSVHLARIGRARFRHQRELPPWLVVVSVLALLMCLTLYIRALCRVL